MHDIVIISSSVRDGRQSHRVALFFQQFIDSRGLSKPEILDLKKYDFPMFEERLSRMDDPEPEWEAFADRVNRADGVLIVSPEYNGGYPASLKNVIDLMHKEWHRKPMAIATVSSGRYGGTQVITSLLFTLWKIGAWMVPAKYHVSNVATSYEEDGRSTNQELTDKLAGKFIDELVWCMTATQRMDESKDE